MFFRTASASEFLMAYAVTIKMDTPAYGRSLFASQLASPRQAPSRFRAERNGLLHAGGGCLHYWRILGIHAFILVIFPRGRCHIHDEFGYDKSLVSFLISAWRKGVSLVDFTDHLIVIAHRSWRRACSAACSELAAVSS